MWTCGSFCLGFWEYGHECQKILSITRHFSRQVPPPGVKSKQRTRGVPDCQCFLLFLLSGLSGQGARF